MSTNQNEVARALMAAMPPAPWRLTLKVGAPPIVIDERMTVWAEHDAHQKMRLMVRVGTGSPVELAIEP